MSKTSKSPSTDHDTILELEYKYASETAFQAMEDRHKIVSFFISLTGIVSSVIFGINEFSKGINPTVIAFFSYIGFVIGLLFLMNLVRLRQAWHESIRVMNQIKSYYFQKSVLKDLKDAFLWREETIPKPEKGWTIFFFSVILIALLDSILFAVSLLFFLPGSMVTVYVIGISIFIAQLALYFAMLKWNK